QRRLADRVFGSREAVGEPELIGRADARMKRRTRARAIQISKRLGSGTDEGADLAAGIDAGERAANAVGAVHGMVKPGDAKRIAASPVAQQPLGCGQMTRERAADVRKR